MDIKQIQCFIAVAEELSFTAAAERMFLSQPSLTRHIQNLEAELGLPLFKRNKKTVELTSAGIQLLANARDIVGSGQEMLKTAKNLQLGKMGKLRIGYQGSAAAVVPDILRKFAEKYPNIDLVVQQFGAHMLLQKLNARELDVIINFSVIRDRQSEYDYFRRKTIFTDDMVMFTGPVLYEKLKRHTPRLEEFADQTIYMISEEVNPGYTSILYDIYRKNQFHPKVPVQQPQLLATLMLLVEADLGVSLLPRVTTLKHYPDCPYLYVDGTACDLPIEIEWMEENFNPCLPLFLNILSAV